MRLRFHCALALVTLLTFPLGGESVRLGSISVHEYEPVELAQADKLEKVIAKE